MDLQKAFKSVEKATVDIIKDGNQYGRGVLIPKNMILTAAHCVTFTNSGLMVLGEYFLEHIQTQTGNIVGSIEMVESVSDLCIIGPPDNQELYKESIKFENFCRDTKPVKICSDKVEAWQKSDIYILNLDRQWIKGTAEYTCYLNSPMVSVIADAQIEGGASGGPIINDKGQLVGIVSNFQQNINSGDKCGGMMPRPLLALPVWIVKRIMSRKDPDLT